MSLFHVKEFERDDDPEYPATDYCKPTDHCFRCGEVLDDDLLVFVDGRRRARAGECT